MPVANSPGERSLFFTHRTNEEGWRLTEKVAAVLEGNFVGHSDRFFSFSTASLPNGTPFPPPVDVVFSSTPDPLSAFAFVQVKDYEHDRVGREYIDAVIGQRVQTGIPSCTVVSTGGFTKPALALAASQGVNLRILTVDAALPYLGYLPDRLGIHPEPYLRLREAVVILTRPGQYTKLPLAGAELLRPNLTVDGKVASVNDVFNDALLSPAIQQEVDSQIKQNPNASVANIGHEFHKVKVLARTTEGLVNGGAIAYHADILRPAALESAVSRRYLYHDPLRQQHLAWCVMADFELEGLLNYELQDARYHFCVWRFPNGENDRIGGAFFPE